MSTLPRLALAVLALTFVLGAGGDALAQSPPLFETRKILPGNIERFCEYWGRGY
jgi:hypothetical protein